MNSITLATGQWSEKELQQLQGAVQEFMGAESKDFSNIPWSKVAEKIPKRNPGQCRSKW